MFWSVLYTELRKYKRSFIPLMAVIAGFLTASTAILIAAAPSSKLSWDVIAVTGLNCLNPLSLLLVAVFSGYAFAYEYADGSISTLFTYPIPRLFIYMAKLVIILILTIFLYFAFFLSSMFLGVLNIGKLPDLELFAKFFKVTAIVCCVNFILVPVTVLITNLIKAAGTYILTGIGYFIVYIIFINTKYSLFLPTCIPDKLVSTFLIVASIDRAEFKQIIIVCSVIFVSAFIAGAVQYSKSDVYK